MWEMVREGGHSQEYDPRREFAAEQRQGDTSGTSTHDTVEAARQNLLEAARGGNTSVLLSAAHEYAAAMRPEGFSDLPDQKPSQAYIDRWRKMEELEGAAQEEPRDPDQLASAAIAFARADTTYEKAVEKGGHPLVVEGPDGKLTVFDRE